MGKIGAEQAVQREPPGRRQGGRQHRRQQDGQQYIEETEAREYEIVRHRPEGTEAEKQKSAEFINYILNSVECNEILLGERGVPINSNVREAIYDKVDDVTQKTFDFIDLVAEHSSAPEQIDPSAGQEIDVNAQRMRDEVLYGKKTAAEAGQEWMEMAQKLLNE